MRYFTEEELKNYYKKVIEEGEYATELTVGEYSTPQDANAVLNAVRKQYGFGRYDSWVDGTTVKVVIEKDRYDSDYFYDMMNDLKSYSAQYKQVDESVEERLRDERNEVNIHPTEGQAKAGNYKMGHITIHGFEISIENPKGSYRCGKDKDGKAWKTYMHNDYGYFNRTVGKDGDAIDVFLGPNLNSQKIFAVDQYLSGEFDETKVMMGFDTKEEAKAAYLSNYDKNWKGFKYITEVDIDTFKKWLYDGYRQRKAFAKYASLTESIINENMINESFSSRKLAQYAKEHGGIEIWRNGGMRNGANAWQRGNSIDLSQVTDDMLNGEPVNYDNMKNKDNAILFNDGTAVQLKPYSEVPAPEKKSKPSRYMTGIGDTGDHDKKPPFNNPDAKIQKQEYNPWGISQKAAEAHYGREAIQNNKNDIDYINSHKENYPNWKKLTSDANNNIRNIKDQMFKEVNENKCGRKIYLTEAQFKNYCRTLLKEKRKEEYIKKLINETKKPQ